jgi:uncharacterized protein YdhG (YjbR/CyaY superfamily)
MSAKAKQPNPAAVDAWLARLPHDQRAALERLRNQIRAAAPEAVETVGYGIPMFYVGTTPLVGFNAAKNHVALTVASGTLFDTMGADLEGYDTAKGTLRFTPSRPLPAALVKKLVKARLAEQAAGKTVS